MDPSTSTVEISRYKADITMHVVSLNWIRLVHFSDNSKHCQGGIISKDWELTNWPDIGSMYCKGYLSGSFGPIIGQICMKYDNLGTFSLLSL